MIKQTYIKFMRKSKSMNIISKNKKFLIFWLSQFFSEIGGAITSFVLVLYITNNAHTDYNTPVILSLNYLAFNLTYVLSQIIVGGITDTFSRKKILLYSHLFGAIIAFCLIISLSLQMLSIPLLLLLSGLLGLTHSFTISSFTASYVMIVSPNFLNRANGMTEIMFGISKFIAPTITLFFMGFSFFNDMIPKITINNLVFPIVFDLLTYIMAFIIIWHLNIRNPKKTKIHLNFFSNIKEGVLFINKPLFNLLLLISFGNLFLSILSELYPIISRIFSDQDEYKNKLAFITTLGGFGTLLGSLFVIVTGGFKENKVRGVIWPLLIAGILQFLLIFSNSFLFITFAVSLILFTLPIITAHSSSIWQSSTPKEMQGVVFSVRRVVTQSTYPIASIFVGIIGKSHHSILWISSFGLLMVTITIIFLSFKRNRAL